MTSWAERPRFQGSVAIPCNDYAEDDREAAKTYMVKFADGLSTEAIIDAFIDNASPMINFITEQTGVQSGHRRPY